MTNGFVMVERVTDISFPVGSDGSRRVRRLTERFDPVTGVRVFYERITDDGIGSEIIRTTERVRFPEQDVIE
jgi:hypothetical protein